MNDSDVLKSPYRNAAAGIPTRSYTVRREAALKHLAVSCKSVAEDVEAELVQEGLNVRFDSRAVARVAQLVARTIERRWAPDIESFAEFVNHESPTLEDAQFLFRRDPDLMSRVNALAASLESSSGEEDDEPRRVLIARRRTKKSTKSPSNEKSKSPDDVATLLRPAPRLSTASPARSNKSPAITPNNSNKKLEVNTREIQRIQKMAHASKDSGSDPGSFVNFMSKRINDKPTTSSPQRKNPVVMPSLAPQKSPRRLAEAVIKRQVITPFPGEVDVVAFDHISTGYVAVQQKSPSRLLKGTNNNPTTPNRNTATGNTPKKTPPRLLVLGSPAATGSPVQKRPQMVSLSEPSPPPAGSLKFRRPSGGSIRTPRFQMASELPESRALMNQRNNDDEEEAEQSNVANSPHADERTAESPGIPNWFSPCDHSTPVGAAFFSKNRLELSMESNMPPLNFDESISPENDDFAQTEDEENINEAIAPTAPKVANQPKTKQTNVQVTPLTRRPSQRLSGSNSRKRPHSAEQPTTSKAAAPPAKKPPPPKELDSFYDDNI